MKQHYMKLPCVSNRPVLKKFGGVFTALLTTLLLATDALQAQNTYTLGTGTEVSSALGVSPFATINRNSRSQYLYYAQELLDQDAISGNIVAIEFNIATLALPVELKPENVTVKMGLTDDVALGTTLIEDLPVYYVSSIENINATGWYMLTLQTPFEWDGLKNIVVEICHNNVEFGTSFEVETTLYDLLDYRTVGLYSNETSVAGCDLTGETPMTNTNRRTRPNIRFTMTSPCDGTPTAGTTVVTAGPYCSGAPFTLSIQDGAVESGLFYQWQSAPNENGPWTDILGANNAAFTTTQAVATWYRRTTTCLESQQTIDAQAVLVGGEGCYCTSLVQNENAIGITNVTFNTIDNSSDATGAYTNFTNIGTEVQRSMPYDLSARVNTMGGANYTRAWIDWNADGAYTADEAIDIGTVTGGSDVSTGTTSVMIPLTAVLGPTKMRVRTSQSAGNAMPEPCDAIENGEAEDYSLVITEELGISDSVRNQNGLLFYGVGRSLHIDLREGEIASVRIYDLGGRLLATRTDVHTPSVVFEDFGAARQILIAKVVTADGAILHKKAAH
jgi:hypothetical protein